jgi:DNA polymerase bacteriophage-type
MIKKLFCDFETFSTVDISRTLANYMPACSVLMCAWAIDDGPIRIWDVAAGEPMPVELYHAVHDPSVWLVAHNSPFEYQVIKHTSIFGNIDIPLERFYCTLAQALEHNLPAALDNLCEVFRLDEDKRKQREGKALIKWFCTPNEQGLFRGMEPADKWLRFKEYCRMDVESMRELHKMMPKVNYPFDNAHVERKLWLETTRMNDRGFGVDLDLANAAVTMAARLADEGDIEMMEATGGVVKSANQVAVLKQYILDTYNVDLPDMQASTLERVLNDISQPVGARQLIKARVESSKASVAKYKKLLHCADSRGRMTGTIVFCGASGSGRDSGRTFQPQNLPRPKPWFDGEYAEQLIAEAKDGTLDLTHSNPMAVLSSALRGSIIPAQGKKLVVSDLSNIEGRMASWLAGEDWKVQFFRDYDSGKIRFDNYQVAYGKALGVKVENVTKDQRQIGKTMELALQFGSGCGGLLQFMEVYHVDLPQLAKAMEAAAIPSLWSDVLQKFDWAQKNKFDYGLPLHQWAACEYLKQQWRNAHPNISSLWSDCEMAFRQAYMTPDVWFPAGQHIAYKRKGSWIFCRLPSGRVLCYISPKIVDDEITYMTQNQTSHKWVRTKIYAGKFVAHATQATARDLLFQNMLKAKEKNYTTVMRVHDELICEVPDEEKYSADELGAIIATPLPWCPDLPLAAAGYETKVRYKKD